MEPSSITQLNQWVYHNEGNVSCIEDLVVSLKVKSNWIFMHENGGLHLDGNQRTEFKVTPIQDNGVNLYHFTVGNRNLNTIQHHGHVILQLAENGVNFTVTDICSGKFYIQNDGRGFYVGNLQFRDQIYLGDGSGLEVEIIVVSPLLNMITQQIEHGILESSAANPREIKTTTVTLKANDEYHYEKKHTKTKHLAVVTSQDVKLTSSKSLQFAPSITAAGVTVSLGGITHTIQKEIEENSSRNDDTNNSRESTETIVFKGNGNTVRTLFFIK